jgi:hypothetical protein
VPVAKSATVVRRGCGPVGMDEGVFPWAVVVACPKGFPGGGFATDEGDVIPDNEVRIVVAQIPGWPFLAEDGDNLFERRFELFHHFMKMDECGGLRGAVV